MSWREHYRARRISTEDAARLVKPGMRVHFPLAGGPVMQRALAARARELDGAIDLRLSSPLVDPGWLTGELADIFRIEFEFFIGNLGRPLHDRHLATYLPNLLAAGFKAHDERPAEDKPIDISFINTGPPNRAGFVSFGPHQWNKRMYARRARCVVAEVDENITRTHGDVYMHVSEFDYFVDATPPPPDAAVLEAALAKMNDEKRDGLRAVIAEVGVERIWPLIGYLERATVNEIRALLGISEPPEAYKAIAGYLNEVLQDGATIQIGVGEPSSQMPALGAFNHKHDLGLHTEMVAPGIARLVVSGVINGRSKTVHRGKASRSHGPVPTRTISGLSTTTPPSNFTTPNMCSIYRR
ncbi:MAG: hypothetical protein ACREQF_02855 [Candidatus Binataceae bacterium]